MTNRHTKFAQAATCLLAVLISACDYPPVPPPTHMHLATSRPVATIYKIRATDSNHKVACYLIRENRLEPLTVLPSDDLVDIVAIEEGLRQYHGELWLHIYPRLTHRPSCYVNVNNLIPYS